MMKIWKDQVDRLGENKWLMMPWNYKPVWQKVRGTPERFLETRQ
jgi:hypothetical protein